MTTLKTYDALTRALNAHVRQSTRAEELERYEDFFVDFEGSDDLLGTGSQLVYGRGGTGKTLLFRTLSERTVANAKETRVASIYFDAARFAYSPDCNRATSVRERTHVHFQFFIEQQCEELVNLADDLIARPGWWAHGRTASEARERRENVLRLSLELLDVAKYGVPIAMPADATSTHSHESEEASHYGKKVGGSIDLSIPSGATVGVQASFAGDAGQCRVVRVSPASDGLRPE